MEVSPPEIRQIPYKLSDGQEKEAVVLPVQVNLKGLSPLELKVLRHLSEAVDGINPIYAQQQDHRVMPLLNAVLKFAEQLSGEQSQMVRDYATLLAARAGIYDIFGKSYVFPIPRDKLPKNCQILEFEEILWGAPAPEPGRALYPPGVSKKDVEALKQHRDTVNSTVVRSADGKLVAILNEERFKEVLKPVISALRKARDTANDPNLKSYIDAKIDELESGTKEARRASDLAWLENNSGIDFTLGTGVETYLDKLMGWRGAALGAVLVINQEYEQFANALLGLMDVFESEAPWLYKKRVNRDNLPRLRFVDVLNWAGFYNVFPSVVVAQSLPNDKEVVDKYGSVNLIFCNINLAISRVSSEKWAELFFVPSEVSGILGVMPSIGLKMTALHELGHTTGRVLYKKEPHTHFGDKYAIMEEARAELFSMGALSMLVEEGLITEEEKIAGYYSMLESLLSALRFPPIDHSGARNIMFHYFLEQGAVRKVKHKGKVRFVVDPARMEEAIPELLGYIGNIKALGWVDAVDSLVARYVSTSRRAWITKATADLPLGRALIFPEVLSNGQTRYPASFLDQRRIRVLYQSH
ncbi:hypothetical protein DRJ48_01645 [Candidatus Woesearchaeota archaeon]|nr:hypothetical protein [Candidatus Woesearchaeota archaeon]RLE43191.1 MAG: hypothetical protein DRJ48_01645 [Candidatus Woesearchaeota archaeon]